MSIENLFARELSFIFMIIKQCFSCDFFLWGLLKSKVYISLPGDLERIESSKEESSKELSTRPIYFTKMSRRMQVCIERNGGHAEGN